MPPLDATNLLPLDSSNSPTLDGNAGQQKWDDLEPPPFSGGAKPGSLGPNKWEGDSEVDEEVPWLDLSLKEVIDDGDFEEEKEKVNVSEDVSEEESDEEEDTSGSNNGESEEKSSEEKEEDEEEEETSSLRDLAKFPVKNPKNRKM